MVAIFIFSFGIIGLIFALLLSTEAKPNSKLERIKSSGLKIFFSIIAAYTIIGIIVIIVNSYEPSKHSTFTTEVKQTRKTISQYKTEGFRGIKWGTDIYDLLGMEELNYRHGDIKHYYRPDDELTIADVPIDRIHYIFYQDKFYRVHIDYYGNSLSFARIEGLFSKVYKQRPELSKILGVWYWEWDMEDVSTGMVYSDDGKFGQIGIRYKPIAKSAELYEKQYRKGRENERFERYKNDV